MDRSQITLAQLIGQKLQNHANVIFERPLTLKMIFSRNFDYSPMILKIHQSIIFLARI
jgi:hypothetical protein